VRPERAADLRAALGASADSLLAYFERRVRHREDAADLLADTMLQAWRRCDALPHEVERQRMWLYTIAANVLANQNRATRRRTALAERLRAQLRQAEVPDPAEGVEVRDAVARLPEAQRELVMLIHWDGLSIVEAAVVLGLNPSTARSRYSTAREQLRLALTDITAPR
jgi:RNA polymerase sigma-70 factor (ECF subfamily)